MLDRVPNPCHTVVLIFRVSITKLLRLALNTSTARVGTELAIPLPQPLCR